MFREGARVCGRGEGGQACARAFSFACAVHDRAQEHKQSDKNSGIYSALSSSPELSKDRKKVLGEDCAGFPGATPVVARLSLALTTPSGMAGAGSGSDSNSGRLSVAPRLSGTLSVTFSSSTKDIAFDVAAPSLSLTSSAEGVACGVACADSGAGSGDAARSD